MTIKAETLTKIKDFVAKLNAMNEEIDKLYEEIDVEALEFDGLDGEDHTTATDALDYTKSQINDAISEFDSLVNA